MVDVVRLCRRRQPSPDSTRPAALEALAKIPSFKPAAIISGLQMPRMRGMELLKIARHQVPQISCIIITGDVNAEKATEVIDWALSAFLRSRWRLIDFLHGFEKVPGTLPTAVFGWRIDGLRARGVIWRGTLHA